MFFDNLAFFLVLFINKKIKEGSPVTIGEALKQIRHELYLTQEQMCAGVVTRSFYAKVESGRNRISADKLTEILFEHDIDITYFYQLLRNTYSSQSKLKDEPGF